MKHKCKICNQLVDCSGDKRCESDCYNIWIHEQCSKKHLVALEKKKIR